MSRTWAALYCVYEDTTWLGDSIAGIYDEMEEIFVLISDRPWSGSAAPMSRAAAVSFIRSLPDPGEKIRVVEGTWADEETQRNAGLDAIFARGYEYAWIIDGDEVYHPKAVRRMKDYMVRHPQVEVWDCGIVTYWKSPELVIEPPEPLQAVVGVRRGSARFVSVRHTNSSCVGSIPRDVGECHHLSYAGPNERIKRKLETFSHSQEVVDGWFERVWLAWDEDTEMTDLHPTVPHCYHRAVTQPRYMLPAALKKYVQEKERVVSESPVFSIVVPVKNEAWYTRKFVESLERLGGATPYELIFVDSGSDDETLELYDEIPCRVVRYDPGRRFRFLRALNLGAKHARGRYLLFCNNDIIFGSQGFLDALARILSDDRVGAVSPERASGTEEVSECQGFRRFHSIYIYGACFAMRKDVWERLGGFCEEYDGYGCEEHDIALRLRRLGLRIVHADHRVVHWATRTFRHVGDSDQCPRNVATFARLWRYDPGFDPYKSPDLWRQFEDYANSILEVEDAARARQSMLRGPCRLGIGVTTWNRVDVLKETLPAILWTTEGIDCELVVSDDGSTDGTQEYLERSGVHWETGPHGGVAASKNRLLRRLLASECDYIIIIEDDVLPLRWGWPYYYMAAMQDTGIEHFNYVPSVAYAPREIVRLGAHRVAYCTSVTGLVMAMTRRALETVGAFDERFGEYGYEHVDWTTRCARAGLTSPPQWYAHLMDVDGHFSALDYARSKGRHRHRSTITPKDRDTFATRAAAQLAQNDRERLVHIPL